MTTYKVGLGWNVPLGSLTTIVPQPHCEGIKYARTTYTASGGVVREGPYVELVWAALGDASMYQSLLNQFGLQSATTSQVTVYIRDERWQDVRKNGVALLPVVGDSLHWRDLFPRDVVILIRDLQDAT